MKLKNIKDSEREVIRKEEKIMERERQYFKKLLEGRNVSKEKQKAESCQN